MANELNNLKAGEKETVITGTCAVTVERTGRGSYATVTDSGSEQNGEYAFASTPALALSILLDKISAAVAA